MRAYAIVRKPQPGLHEHVIKVTKQEPKISIHPISENRLTSPHKTVANNLHELQNSGAYFKFNNQPEEQSVRSLKSNSKLEEKQKIEEQNGEKEDEIEIKIARALPVQENQPKVERTKRLFQEFPASPIKIKEDPRQEKLNATPVRLLEAQPQISVLPAQSVIHQPKKPRIFDHHERQEQPEHYESPTVKDANLIIESDQKNVFCCGEVSSESLNEPAPPPVMTFSKLPLPQFQTRQRQDSSKKRRIFQDFQDRERVVQQFTFKEPRIRCRNPQILFKQPAQRSLKIKIYEFAPIAPFDI